MGLEFIFTGDYRKTTSFLTRLRLGRHYDVLTKYGDIGVAALQAATPRDTGVTANSWTYTITSSPTKYSINWDNTNRQNGIKIALILQLGHGTGGGGYVTGIDYINPALRRVFDNMTYDLWREVTR